MPFREKRAWFSFISILLVSSVYFTYLISAYINDQSPSFEYLTNLALVAIIVFVVIEIVLYLGLIYLSSPDDRMPRDEREKAIVHKATQIAFTALVALALVSALIITHHPQGYNWLMGNVVLMAVVLAELTKHGLQIVFYRRG